jgi:hypothetical protein
MHLLVYTTTIPMIYPWINFQINAKMAGKNTLQQNQE